MAEFVSVAARLRAVERGCAQRIAARRQVAIQPDAIVLTLLSMAGEDTSVHAIAVGRLGHPAEIRVVGDPRRRDDQYDLLRWLLPKVETYYAACEAAGTFPQIWVSSGGALGHLDTLADRLRFTEDVEIQKLGVLLTYAGERSPVAGQQSLISATAALIAHYATGQQEAEDEHLGALLTWIEPPPGRDLYAAIAVAEAQPMSFKTDPEFDRNVLAPAVKDFGDARRDGLDPSIIQHRLSRVKQVLETVIRPIYTATQRAAALLMAEPWRPSDALAALEIEEARAFRDFMVSRSLGFHLPYRDKPKSGALKIIARERAETNVSAGALRHDAGAREIGVVRGRVLRATLVESDRRRLRPRIFAQTLVFTTPQEDLHLRANDVIWTLDGDKIGIRIIEIDRRGLLSWITAEVDTGIRASKSITVGDVFDFGPEAPNWSGLGFEVSRAASRLQATPWTHGDTLPAVAPIARPHVNDLLSLVENLT